MLRATGLVLLAALVGIGPLVTVSPAQAATECGRFGPVQNCDVSAGAPGGGGGAGPGIPGGSGGSNTCYNISGAEVQCSFDGGFWYPNGQCYAKPADATEEEQEAHPGQTKYRCAFSTTGPSTGMTITFWLTPAEAPTVNPRDLAQQALDSMTLRPIAPATAPPSGSTTLLGIPTWVWAQNSGPSTTGGASASASAGGVTVTADAAVARVIWDFGDGTTKSCGPNSTPYHPSYGSAPSPTCGHTYSQPGTYQITARSDWSVTWWGGGQSGVITFSLNGPASTVTVAESYGLVTG